MASFAVWYLFAREKQREAARLFPLTTSKSKMVKFKNIDFLLSEPFWWKWTLLLCEELSLEQMSEFPIFLQLPYLITTNYDPFHARCAIICNSVLFLLILLFVLDILVENYERIVHEH